MGRKMDAKLVERGGSVMQPDGARRISERTRKVSKIRSLFLARCVISFITKQFGGMWGGFCANFCTRILSHVHFATAPTVRKRMSLITFPIQVQSIGADGEARNGASRADSHTQPKGADWN